ncbi:tripartite tricarboxylate transporter substrate binding protein [Streptomyces mayteni]
MRLLRPALAVLAATALAGTACAPQDDAAAADYPSRAIDLIVPFAAGGATDIAARAVATALSDDLGVPVNVVNQPGANQITAVNTVRSAGADGYTLLADGAGSSSLQSLLPDVPYDWQDRAFVGRAASGAHVYAVPGDSEYADLQDVVEAARANPGGFSVGWIGGTSTSDYATLQFLEAAGVDPAEVRRVPFQGSGDVMQAVAAGDIDFGAGGASATFALAGSGDLRVLASTGAEPLERLPDVPLTGDLGLSELDVQFWVGLSGPSGLPDPVADRLGEALTRIGEDPEFGETLASIGMIPDVRDGDATAQAADEEAGLFAELDARLGDAG